MIKEKRFCTKCNSDYEVYKSEKLGTNGAFLRYNKNGTRAMGSTCQSCVAADRKRKWESRESDSRSYEKTKKGFLMRKYRNMKSRILGIQKKKFHLYEGKSLIEKELFYRWAESSPQFHALFEEWEKSGYDRKLSPSVDRIDSEKGYIMGNLEWITHSENSRRGALSDKRKKKTPSTAN